MKSLMKPEKYGVVVSWDRNPKIKLSKEKRLLQEKLKLVFKNGCYSQDNGLNLTIITLRLSVEKFSSE
jgi:hypothetical protein